MGGASSGPTLLLLHAHWAQVELTEALAQKWGPDALPLCRLSLAPLDRAPAHGLLHNATGDAAGHGVVGVPMRGPPMPLQWGQGLGRLALQGVLQEAAHFSAH
eukprot:CAMPEP_0174298082 /NCGR_PEP_ID=MMETSP0809-20121228/52757_1 /TAXON_ID=73025 ORGANISM="Eutreptiella gymnastica-like, Strain CCMP1594" /NCGR_SAMPLE_ID=MMETSP0809 /ASSEMBLY_ACC=CAM_ASM_000658 /LENGTH=102 /DNA_ID=CAMNT_0015402289 /DNA_START=1536 /DNA_END=1844 /DNA_ORIENTATION=+